MKSTVFLSAILGVTLAGLLAAQTGADLPTPGFHHLHINSVNPDAAIDWYTKAFATATRTTFDGKPAIKTGKIYLLFNKVNTPPKLASPQTAIWHWGWNVPDERAYMAKYAADRFFKILPLWTGEGDDFVNISSDFYPGVGGLGRTKEQIAEAKEQGLKPALGAGFGYLAGPDDAMIEVAGNSPERFNHVHMFQDDPLCAVLWYQKHLNVKPRAGRGGRAAAPVTEETCKQPHGPLTWVSLEKDGMYRAPAGGVSFDDIAMNWYVRTVDYPLTSTLGHTGDHIGLSVNDLDAWYKKMQAEGVKILKPPYKLDKTRAFMIEGPSKEALELVEVK